MHSINFAVDPKIPYKDLKATITRQLIKNLATRVAHMRGFPPHEFTIAVRWGPIPGKVHIHERCPTRKEVARGPESLFPDDRLALS